MLATKLGIVRDRNGGVRVDARPERVRGDCEAWLARPGVGLIAYSPLGRGFLTGAAPAVASGLQAAHK